MVIMKDGFQVPERWRIDSADESIAIVAAQIASLVASGEPALVKRCAGPGTLWFVDCTNAHTRVFCSATACGNRAKVAAFANVNDALSTSQSCIRGRQADLPSRAAPIRKERSDVIRDRGRFELSTWGI